MPQHFSSPRHLSAKTLLSLLLTAPAMAANTTPKMTPSWPRATEVRQEWNFNQGWRFFLPPSAPPAYLLPAADRVGAGSFSAANTAQDVKFKARTARYVVLESLSSENATSFASLAEFWLLDANGKPLPRTGWKAKADSEETGSGDLAANAIDSDPATKWHSQWQSAQPAQPHYLVIDTGRATTFSGFRMLPRADGNAVSKIKDWRFYATNSAQFGREETATAVSKINDATWQRVNLPHTVRLEPLNASGGRNYQGICWYRKHFSADNAWKSRKIYLKFEGAMHTANVWLNGVPLPTHYGGYLPFTVDISRAVRYGADNVLTMRLNNADDPEVPPGKPQNQLDFSYFGGLYRNVSLQVLAPLHITDEALSNTPAGGGIFVTTPQVSPASSTLRVQSEIANESALASTCTVSQQLIAPDGSVSAQATATAPIAANARHVFAQSLQVLAAKLWHPYHPWLYVLHTTVSQNGRATDDQWTRVGFRTLRFDRDLGMLINGERFFSSGANRHQDHPYVGAALPDSAQYRDAKKLRDAGFTSYRSHYPQSPAFMDACDELGILAIVSNPGWQFMGDDVFKQRVYQDAREMVRRDRNHVSVVLWEAQLNEVNNLPVAATLQRIIHQEYPGPECYTAGDRSTAPPTGDFPGWDVEYTGNAGKVAGWWREWGDQVDNWGDQQSSSRVPRGWGELPMLVQSQGHLKRWQQVLAYDAGPPKPDRGRLGGADLWAGIDCYRGYHHQPFYGGALDLFRLPKFDWYQFQSQRPPQVQVPGADGGPMVFIANFATFHSPSAVTVFSNCQEVRLTQNGKIIGTQKPDVMQFVAHPPFTFKADAFSGERSMLFASGVNDAGVQAGELKAEGLINGQVVATHVVRSPGVPSRIELSADYAGRDLTADGADWIRVYARLTDGNGTTYPYGDDLVTFSAEGPGAIIGDATIGANPTRAEAGIATALVRAGTTPGKITVRAEAFGLRTGSVEIESKADTVKVWPR